MSEAEYATFLKYKETKTKVLVAYEAFVKVRLLDTPQALPAQDS